ncbi:hypothetical protein BOTBODRAFT_35402 [Botryobasidium botryosum FD-172 SS1]|uniref:Uncharacterized protein n=1 Tax=Botryobasidium botryosum (strain FD-172 SS1) TaxID=930990 RepID=A0A067M6F8_BOTB1|nr:hypothetical protein BOTBODRAFT_35402 [Botryobasidium botryosum FD-172 SS1]
MPLDSPKLLVTPSLPTALGTRERLEIPGSDLLVLFVHNVHVLPDAIKEDKFCDALVATLAVYPHAAGRLKREGDNNDWHIALTNSPVPVFVSVCDDDAVVPEDRVVQDDNSRLLPHSRVVVTNADEPLLRFKITNFRRTGETALGISWHHVLGDAYALLCFTHTLSSFYQGLPSPYPQPTFAKHFFSPPPIDPATVSTFEAIMPHLVNDYDRVGLIEKLTKMLEETEQVHLRFSKSQLEEIRDRVHQDAVDGETFSRQDCLTAYLVTVLTRVLDVPVQRVITVLNYRNISDRPFAHSNLAGNSISVTFSSIIAADDVLSLSAIARAVRASITRARDPEFEEMWMTFASYYMKRTADADRSPWYGPDEGEANVNSNYGFDWNAAHFGFPGRARFYTAFLLDRQFRVFRANPTKLKDGTWVSNEGAVDVAFRIWREAAEKAADVVRADFGGDGHDSVIFPTSTRPS